MGKPFHKPKPSPPPWYWLDTDGCWWCKYRNNQKGCTNCKNLKEYVYNQKAKQKRKDRNLLKNMI